MSTDLSDVKEAIRRLQFQIEERADELRQKIDRIRQRAEADERYEANRAYDEVEPLRRQMEAMILSVAKYEALQMPPRTIRIFDDKSATKFSSKERAIMNHMVEWFISRLLVYLAISIGCGALTIIGAALYAVMSK